MGMSESSSSCIDPAEVVPQPENDYYNYFSNLYMLKNSSNYPKDGRETFPEARTAGITPLTEAQESWRKRVIDRYNHQRDTKKRKN